MKSLVFGILFCSLVVHAAFAVSEDFDLSTPDGQAHCSRALVSRADADYVAHVERYVQDTDRVTPAVQAERDTFLKLLPTGAKTVISIGEGFGRDVRYFRSQGLRAIGTDGSLQMVTRAAQYLGSAADFFHLTAQDFSLARVGGVDPVDGIWAMASLHHVPVHELAGVLIAMKNALRPGGVVHASFIMGVGQPDQAEIAKGRFWSRISAATLHGILNSIPQFELIDGSGAKVNDFFAQVPEPGFHFYTVWLRRKAK